MIYKFDHIKEIISNCHVIGNIAEIRFKNIKPITEADYDSLVWLNPSRKDKKDLIKNTKAKIIVMSNEDVELAQNKILIVCDNPKLIFIKIVSLLNPEIETYEIHPTTVLGKNVKITGKHVSIGPFCLIDDNVEIGENVVIKSHCKIGKNTKIRNNVLIHSHVSIGTDGFGYSRNNEGVLEKFPHIGGVTICDDVEIGSNTCIDRGTLGDTVISNGVKIDNLVHIAHNVYIGKNSVIIANSLIGGSTIIGENVWIAPCVCIRDAIKIGNNVTIGMGSVVTKDISDNETYIGNPAKPIEIFKSINQKLNQLINSK